MFKRVVLSSQRDLCTLKLMASKLNLLNQDSNLYHSTVLQPGWMHVGWATHSQIQYDLKHSTL